MEKKSFLVELGVILAALAVVLGLTFTNLEKSRRTQRDLNRFVDLGTITGALEVYRAKHALYPPATAGGRMRACGWQGLDECRWSEVWEDEKYIYAEKLPLDGLVALGRNWPDYFYQTPEDRGSYTLVVTLEGSYPDEVAASHQRCPGDWQPNQLVECR